MKRDEYYAAIEAYKANRVEHGGEWKNHKYVRIENGRYIYPEDNAKIEAGRKHGWTDARQDAEKRQMNTQIKAAGASIGQKVTDEDIKNVNAEHRYEQVAGAVNDATDRAANIFAKYLKGDDKNNPDDMRFWPLMDACLKKSGIDPSKTSGETDKEMRRMVVTQLISRLKEGILDDPDNIPERTEKLRKEIEEAGKEWALYRPYKDKKASTEDFEKTVKSDKKLNHSFSSPEEYRAAINAYKTAKRSVPR